MEIFEEKLTSLTSLYTDATVVSSGDSVKFEWIGRFSLLVCCVLFSGCNSFQGTVKKEEQQLCRQLEEQNIAPKHFASEFAEKSGKVPEKPEQVIEDLLDNGELDLYELLTIAFEQNPSTRVAWHQALIAAGQKLKADSTFYPRINLGVRGSRSEQFAGVDDSGCSQTSFTTLFSPQAEITYTLYKFGAHKEASLVALSALEASRFQFNQTLQDVAYGVQRAYFAFDSALATVEANQQNLEDARIALDAAQNRHQSGLVNKQDLLKAQAAYSAAVYDLESSRTVVENARASLAEAIGVKVTGELRIARSSKKIIPPQIDDVEQAITEAIGTRQDLLAQEKSLEGKRHLLKEKHLNEYPEIVVGATVSRDKMHHVSGSYNTFNAYIGVQWNLFDGFAKTAERLMAREEVKIAELQLKAKRLAIRSQVWESFYGLKSAVHKLESAKESERCALEAFNCTQASYKNGLCSFTDLLTSQNALSLARRQLVVAENDLAMSWVKLAYCTGKILKN